MRFEHFFFKMNWWFISLLYGCMSHTHTHTHTVALSTFFFEDELVDYFFWFGGACHTMSPGALCIMFFS